ncbi:YitT family protein [Ruminiclostridium herbifermentans]|uniref:YitT family protein n=1 Tax=Ruminiclostridium herbifermentans TaxID=2488810 RepID=A0A4U7JHI5_9FIRM|nr:YitT family protein [Ruminiclostridium herbifermentans]QNU67509.1 YitT family protein [Ruminiclostridium herbifermentans]
MSKLKSILKFLKVYILITIGAGITALAINIFLVPYKIAPGGLSGLATVLFYISNEKLPVGASMLAINIPLFLLGYKIIGRKFFFRTVYGTIVLSAIIDLTEAYSYDFAERILVDSNYLVSTPDIFLYSVIGGFISGIGLGIVLKMDATTGGTELAAKLLNKIFKNMTIGQLILWLDALIILFAIIAFNSILIGLYSLVSLFITTKVIDAMVAGVDNSRAVLIISEHQAEISKRLLVELDRGVTELKGRGVYSGKDKEVLLCVLARTQIQQLKQIVLEVDKNAFMILAEVNEVLGEGFETNDGK